MPSCTRSDVHEPCHRIAKVTLRYPVKPSGPADPADNSVSHVLDRVVEERKHAKFVGAGEGDGRNYFAREVKGVRYTPPKPRSVPEQIPAQELLYRNHETRLKPEWFEIYRAIMGHRTAARPQERCDTPITVVAYPKLHNVEHHVRPLTSDEICDAQERQELLLAAHAERVAALPPVAVQPRMAKGGVWDGRS
jgi:hypothetical protein